MNILKKLFHKHLWQVVEQELLFADSIDAEVCNFVDFGSGVMLNTYKCEACGQIQQEYTSLDK